eukprot:6911857-Lingulodinium_polyedra.AAC.1
MARAWCTRLRENWKTSAAPRAFERISMQLLRNAAQSNLRSAAHVLQRPRKRPRRAYAQNKRTHGARVCTTRAAPTRHNA